MVSVVLIGLAPEMEAIISTALRQDGHAITSQPVHSEVVDQLEHLGCDVVVIDGYPLVNIQAFVEHLRAQECTRTVPVIVISPEAALPWCDGVFAVPLPFELLAFLMAIRMATTPAGHPADQMEVWPASTGGFSGGSYHLSCGGRY